MLIKKISDVMTRDIITVTPSCSLEEALALMAENKISTLAVVEDGRPVGLATEEEILSFAADGGQSKDTSLSQAGITVKLTLDPDVNTLDAAASMEKANVRAAVVTDSSGKLVGIVTVTDILHRLKNEDFVSIRRAKHSISLPGEKVFVSRQESVGGCIGKMVKEAIDCVVVTSHSKPVGIFTRRDAVRLLSKSIREEKSGGKKSPVNEPVSAGMTEPVLTVDEERPLSEVTGIMEEKGIRRMVVVDSKGRLKGLITQKDVLKQLDANYSQIIQRVAADTRTQLDISEARYRELFDNSVDIVIMTDKKGIMEDINAQFTVSTGYDPADWIGKPFKTILAQQDQPGAEHLDRCEERFAGSEFVLHTHFGDKYFYISSWPRYNEEGEIAGNWRVVRDVTEPKLNEKELIKAKHAAEEASLSKNRFLANVSHELRTPLTAIIGFSNLISTNNKIADEIRDQGRIVSRQGKHLLTLINNLIDIVRFEKGGQKPELQEVEIKNIVEAAVERERENAETKQLTFKIKIESSLPKTIVTDEHKLSVILDQLVNNSVKFSNNGVVKITASQEGSQLVFQIKDEGVGINEKQLIKIFDRFYQADSSSTRKYSGAGLGLPLARASLAELGGTIWVKSTPGSGSSFFFSVPLTAVNPDSRINGATRLRVLVAGNDEAVTQLIRNTLGEAGYKSQFAESGDMALRLSQKELFDVVLLNADKSIMKACQAIKQIKEVSGYREVPTIALTGKTVKSDNKKLLAAGFDYCIEKPFMPLDLLHKIEAALPVS